MLQVICHVSTQRILKDRTDKKLSPVERECNFTLTKFCSHRYIFFFCLSFIMNFSRIQTSRSLWAQYWDLAYIPLYYPTWHFWMQIHLASVMRMSLPPSGTHFHLAVSSQAVCFFQYFHCRNLFSAECNNEGLWFPRWSNGFFLFVLAEFSAFSNTLKRCQNQKKTCSVFSQRTEEASAAQYFQVRNLSLLTSACFKGILSWEHTQLVWAGNNWCPTARGLRGRFPGLR